jgi:hypothetical protein
VPGRQQGAARDLSAGRLGVLGRRLAAGGEHRLLEVLHVTVPPPIPIPDTGTLTPGQGVVRMFGGLGCDTVYSDLAIRVMNTLPWTRHSKE